MNIKIISSKQYNNLFSKTSPEVKDFLKEWKKLEKSILKYLQKNAKLRFKSKEITCYIVNNFPLLGISNPLTIKKTDTKTMILILTHELTHILLMQNRPIKSLNKIKKQFPKENKITINHLLVLPILNKTIRKIKPEFYQDLINLNLKLKATKKAQQIIQNLY